MKTIYECILGNNVYFAHSNQDAMQWLSNNPKGKYRNALHNFVIKGDALL